MPNVNRLIRDQGAELHQLLRRAVQLLPLAGLDPVRPLRAQPRRDRQRLAAGRLRPLEADQAGRRPAGLARSGPATAARCSASTSTSTPSTPGSHLSDDAEGGAALATCRRAGSRGPSPVQGNAYAQYHYKLNVDGQVDADFHERLPRLAGSASGRSTLVDGADGFDFAKGGQFLYYASYSPHTPYAYPPELEGSFADVKYPRTPDFDEADVSDKFGLTRDRKPLSPSDVAHHRRDLPQADPVAAGARPDRREAGRRSSKDEGTLDNTYLIFTSDNGYHMGNHRREIGKYTQFQTDVQRAVLRPRPGDHARLDVRRRGRQHRHRADHRRHRRRQHARTLDGRLAARRGCTAARRSTRQVLPAGPGADARPTPRRPTASRRRRRPTSRAAAPASSTTSPA